MTAGWNKILPYGLTRKKTITVKFFKELRERHFFACKIRSLKKGQFSWFKTFGLAKKNYFIVVKIGKSGVTKSPIVSKISILRKKRYKIMSLNFCG